MPSLSRTRLPRDAHLVDHGLVGCPVRGTDVDVEVCLTCPRLKDMAEDGAVTYVRCRQPSLLAELPVPRWLG